MLGEYVVFAEEMRRRGVEPLALAVTETERRYLTRRLEETVGTA